MARAWVLLATLLDGAHAAGLRSETVLQPLTAASVSKTRLTTGTIDEPGEMTCNTRTIEEIGDGHGGPGQVALNDADRGGAAAREANTTYVTTNVTVCDDGRTFSVLVGPLFTTGGYSFTSPFMTINTTEQYDVGAFDISAHAGAPPTDGRTQGKTLGLPPIHFHHGSIGALKGSSDRQCPFQSEGYECQHYEFSEHGWYYTQPMMTSVDSMLNDMRPAGSPNMTWYMNYTQRRVSRAEIERRGLQRISTMTLLNGYERTSPFGTVQLPPEDSYHIRSGPFNFSGIVVTDPHVVWHHSHAKEFQYAFLIAAPVEEILTRADGTIDPRFYSPTGCDPVLASSMGFADNVAVLNELMKLSPHFSFDAPGSKLIAWANGTSAPFTQYGVGPHGNETDTHVWDRMSTFVARTKTVRVDAGVNDTYTVVSFLGPKAAEVDLYSPVAPHPDFRPGYFQQHTVWNLFFHHETDDGTTPVPGSIDVNPANGVPMSPIPDKYLTPLLFNNGTVDECRCTDLGDTNRYGYGASSAAAVSCPGASARE